MGYLSYNRNGGVIEITIRDENMKKIENWKFNLGDKRMGRNVLHHLQKKYGFEPTIKPEQSVNAKSKKPIDWTDVDVDW